MGEKSLAIKTYTNDKSSFFDKRVEKVYNTFDTSTLYPPFPETSLVELSNACNHACIFCTNSRMNRKIGRLDIDLYKKFIKEGVDLGLKEVGLYTTGEPFLIKDINDYISAARDGGVEYIYITTNGGLATPEKLESAIASGLHSIKFSVNGATRESYKLVHGVDDFDKVIKNIKYISEYRKTTEIDLRLMVTCVITKYTEDEEDILKDLLLPYVDDLAFYGVTSQFGQSTEQLESIKSTFTDNPPPIGKASPCSMVWNRIHISNEGYLTLCCGDYENSLTYADLRKTSLKEAWHNKVATRMRQRHLDQDLDNTLCKNCLYGTKDPVYPLTDIGHDKVDQAISSDKERGVRSISERISKLADLKNQG